MSINLSIFVFWIIIASNYLNIIFCITKQCEDFIVCEDSEI